MTPSVFSLGPQNLTPTSLPLSTKSPEKMKAVLVRLATWHHFYRLSHIHYRVYMIDELKFCPLLLVASTLKIKKTIQLSVHPHQKNNHWSRLWMQRVIIHIFTPPAAVVITMATKEENQEKYYKGRKVSIGRGLVMGGRVIRAQV